MDSDEAALKRAIHERPLDDTPQLVLADYYDDAGRPDEAEARRFLVHGLANPNHDYTDHPVRTQPGYARRILPHVERATREIELALSNTATGHPDWWRARGAQAVRYHVQSVASERAAQATRGLATSPPTRDTITAAKADGVDPYTLSRTAWYRSRDINGRSPFGNVGNPDAHEAAMNEHARLAAYHQKRDIRGSNERRGNHEEARNLHHAAAIMLRESAANSPAE